MLEYPEEDITIDEAIELLSGTDICEQYDIISMLKDLRSFRQTYVYHEYCRYNWNNQEPPYGVLFCGKPTQKSPE